MLAALSFMGTDLHAGTYAPMFNPAMTPVKEAFLAKLEAKLTLLESKLKGKKFVLGDEVCGADLYAYVCMGWGQYLGAPDLKTSHPELAAYRERVGDLDFVKAAHAAMAKATPTAA